METFKTNIAGFNEYSIQFFRPLSIPGLLKT